MSRKGPILIIDDDEDDQDLFQKALADLSVTNEIRSFPNGQAALEYLKLTTEKPFLILCDINMPLMNGLELRQHINENESLRRKSIPFVFLTTDANADVVRLAYDLTVQGFYKKADTYSELKHHFKLIVEYWKNCLHPNL